MSSNLHILNIGKSSYYEKMCFTIDFEPVILNIGHDVLDKIYEPNPFYNPKIRGISFWQKIIELNSQITC